MVDGVVSKIYANAKIEEILKYSKPETILIAEGIEPSVTVDGDKFDFGNLQVGKLETLTKNKIYTPNATITTNEEFGFKLYK